MLVDKSATQLSKPHLLPARRPKYLLLDLRFRAAIIADGFSSFRNLKHDRYLFSNRAASTSSPFARPAPKQSES
jgi:hypothetical protein